LRKKIGYDNFKKLDNSKVINITQNIRKSLELTKIENHSLFKDSISQHSSRSPKNKLKLRFSPSSVSSNRFKNNFIKTS
jgi:hypothetical protein